MRVVVSSETNTSIRQALLALGLECKATDCVSFAELPIAVSKGGVDLIAVSVGKDLELTLKTIQEIAGLTRIPILAVGSTHDAQFVLRATRAGASDYLDEANISDELESALRKLQTNGSLRRPQGSVVAVLGARPGSGVSTLAVNLAFAWAEKYPKQVVLLELGRETPDMALSLDVVPRYNIADFLDSWERLDAVLLKHTVVAHSGGVDLLVYPPETLKLPPVLPRAIHRALLLLRTQYKIITLDLGSLFEEEQMEAVRAADRIILVVRMDVPSVRLTRRLLRALDDLGVPRSRLRLVGNRAKQKGQLAWQQVEEALREKLSVILDDDPVNINNALNQGQPVIRLVPRCEFCRNLAGFAGAIHTEV